MQKKRNREQTTINLLNATADLLCNDGSVAPPIAAIAKQAGCDKVLIYRYFGDMDGLLLSIAERYPLYPPPLSTRRDLTQQDDTLRSALEIKVRLTQELQALPLAHSLISHRWYRRNNPLGIALARARQQWLSATQEVARWMQLDPGIIGAVQLLAEENETVADRWLLTQALHPSHPAVDKQASVQPAGTSFSEDVLPDNLL